MTSREHHVQVDGDADRRVLGDDTTVVGGAATLQADEIVLRATQRIVLEVGGNRALLDGAGIVVEAAGGSVGFHRCGALGPMGLSTRLRGTAQAVDAGFTSGVVGGFDTGLGGAVVTGSGPPWPTSKLVIMSWSSWITLWQCIMYFPRRGPNRAITRTVSPSPT